MHKIIYLFILFSPPLCLIAQSHRISQGDLISCNHNLFDTGGNGSDYGNNEIITETYCSAIPGQCVSIHFTTFNTESGFDELIIYDGPTTASPVIEAYSGIVSPGTVTAFSGCLTFTWSSDGW